MKNLIKKILKESEKEWWEYVADDFNPDLLPGQLWWKFKNSGLGDAAGVYNLIADSFFDLHVENNNIFLEIKSYCDFSVLFRDDDRSYNIITESLMEVMYCKDDDFWEPYSDTYGSWYDDIWMSTVLDNEKIYKYILDYFKYYVTPENYNPKQLDIFGNLPEKRKIYRVKDLRNQNGKQVVLDAEYFSWLKENPKELGKLIFTDFRDLRNELAWAYDSAYNTAARDEIHDTVEKTIETRLGVMETYNNGYRVNITKLFVDTIDEFFNFCFDDCKRWAGNRAVDPLEFCDNCHDFQEGKFIDFFSEFLGSDNKKWYPNFDEYPDHDKVSEWFFDDIQSRF